MWIKTFQKFLMIFEVVTCKLGTGANPKTQPPGSSRKQLLAAPVPQYRTALIQQWKSCQMFPCNSNCLCYINIERTLRHRFFLSKFHDSKSSFYLCCLNCLSNESNRPKTRFSSPKFGDGDAPFWIVSKKDTKEILNFL